MNRLNVLLFICGSYSFALAMLQILFWKVFDLNNNMGNLSFTKKTILQIENTWVIYLLLFISLACFLYPHTLFTTYTGKIFLACISLFWLARTFRQFISLKTQSSLVNIFSIVFMIGAILFALPVMLGR